MICVSGQSRRSKSISSIRIVRKKKGASEGGLKHDLVQQRAVGYLLPEAEHDSRGDSGEHGGAGVPDQRPVRPHGLQQLLLLALDAQSGCGSISVPTSSPASTTTRTGK